VKVAQQLPAWLKNGGEPGQHRRPLGHRASGGGPGRYRFGIVEGLQDAFGDVQRGGWTAVPADGRFPQLPDRATIMERTLNPFEHLLVALGNLADSQPANHLGIPLFLAGDDVVDDDRTTRRDGLLNQRATGLGDEEMAGGQ